MRFRPAMWGIGILMSTSAAMAAGAAPGLYTRVASILLQRFYDERFRSEKLPGLVRAEEPKGPDAGAQRAAVQRLLERIPASHLALLSANTYDRLVAELKGELRPTLGMDLTERQGRYYAANILEGGAAEQAGVLPFDEVVLLDGQAPSDSPLLDWRSDDAFLSDERDPPMHYLKVTAGEDVRLRLRREGPEHEYDLVVRAVEDSAFQAAQRSVRLIQSGDRKIGYMHLWYVHLGGYDKLLSSALDGPLSGADSFIFDLRGRGGSGVGVAPILEVLDKAHSSRGLPVVALIDRQTRSAKDLLASELRSRPWVKLVGEPTAGAAVPASFAPVGDGAVLMFPSFSLGEISTKLEGKGGVAPDVPARRAGPSSGGRDPILEAGVRTALTLGRGTAAVPATQSNPPPAASVSSAPAWPQLKPRMLEALGGERVIRGWPERVLTGTAELVGLPMKGRYHYAVAPDGRFRSDASFGQPAVSLGYDGTTGWTRSPQTGVVKLTGPQLKSLRAQNLFYGPLQWEEACGRISVGSDIEFDGRPAHQVICELEGGPITFYVERDTQLTIGARTVADSSIGSVEVVTTYRRYRQFGTSKLPTEILVEAAGQTQKFTVETVDFVPADPAQFAPPE